MIINFITIIQYLLYAKSNNKKYNLKENKIERNINKNQKIKKDMETLFTYFSKEENDYLINTLDKKLMFEILYKANIEKYSYSQIKNILLLKKTGLNEESFDRYKELQKEKDEFLDNPFDVTEGIVDCPRCFKKKTFSYSKQVRSSDEGFTTFNLCLSCNHKWRIN